MMKSLKPWRRARFSPVQMGTCDAARKRRPHFGILHLQRVLEPHRLDRLDGFRDLDRGPQIVFPMAVDHDVVIPADGLAAILITSLDVDQFARGENTIGAVAREVRISAWCAESRTCGP